MEIVFCVIMFVLALCIVTWQAGRVTEAEAETAYTKILLNAELELLNVSDKRLAASKQLTNAARYILDSIATQGETDPHFQLWSKRLASDAVRYLDAKAKCL